MIGALPQSLEVNGTAYPIRTDYRVALTVIEAFGDNNLTAEEKAIIAIECLFNAELLGSLKRILKRLIIKPYGF